MAGTVFVREYLVAGTSLLAALPAGCSVGYPSVLLRQFNSNESSIQLDWDTTSWIGSIHGIAGIPSILMPAFMQWRGRKITFILACLVSIIGWILSYTSTSATSILVSESIQGFGSHSILTVSMFSMSEMLSPDIRKVSMSLYLVMQTLGMGLVGVIGSYLHWRTVSLVICAPLIVVTALAAMWPESPSWLAYKGEFIKCARAFTHLRGTGGIAKTELEELILAQKENLSRDNCIKQNLLKHLLQTLKSRDFYMPSLHILVLLIISYWNGCLAHMIYASNIIESATHSKDAVFYGSMIFSCTLFSCCIIATFLIKYFRPKNVLVVCVSCAVLILLSASAVNYSQIVGWMSKESYLCLYLLIAYMFPISLILPVVMPITAELMPVKHRGIGGPMHVMLTCLLHTSALKSVPYMLKYIDLWGMLLVFAVTSIFCTLFTWKYIPETKGKTLQQLEDYYNYGNFDISRMDADTSICMSEFISTED